MRIIVGSIAQVIQSFKWLCSTMAEDKLINTTTGNAHTNEYVPSDNTP